MKWKLIPVVSLAVVSAVAADPPLRLSESDAKKAATEKPAPEYPLMARQLKVAGKVALEALIATDGRVEEVRIVSGTPILTRSAADALKKWRFKPFHQDGKPVEALAPISFEFDTH